MFLKSFYIASIIIMHQLTMNLKRHITASLEAKIFDCFNILQLSNMIKREINDTLSCYKHQFTSQFLPSYTIVCCRMDQQQQQLILEIPSCHITSRVSLKAVCTKVKQIFLLLMFGLCLFIVNSLDP
jgi:hypothetical protein